MDTARVRPIQSAAGRTLIEPGSPWQNRFVEPFGSRVRTAQCNHQECCRGECDQNRARMTNWKAGAQRAGRSAPN
jgi:hypothetical protein